VRGKKSSQAMPNMGSSIQSWAMIGGVEIMH